MVGISDEERRQYQTGELVHIPSVVVDFNREGWADQLYSSIIGTANYNYLRYGVCSIFSGAGMD